MVAPFERSGYQIMWFATDAVDATGTLFTLPLEVAEDAEAGVYSITVSYAPENTISADYKETVLETGAITIGGQDEALCGDATGDGNLNLSDVILIARYLIGKDTIAEGRLSLADVNGDGKVTNSDVIRLARYLINLETSLR